MLKMDATATEAWDSVISIDNTTKYFDQVRKSGLIRSEKSRLYALRDVSFSIQPGEFVAYAGPNGAGKSTTFKLLCGMLSPQGGTVRVFGKDPTKDRIPIMQKTGVLFGNRSELWWDHPVENSFTWKRRVWSIPDATYKRMFALVCDLLGLSGFLTQFARELSLGQRMRANLGLALLHDPSLILLDEPTLGMDVLAKRQMIAFLKHINKEQGATILVTSHDMDDLTEMAQRMILINNGEIAFDGDHNRLMKAAGDRRTLRFSAPMPVLELRGASLVSIEEENHVYEYNADKTSIAELLRKLSDIPGISNVETGRAPIEAVIAELYQQWQS